jgi:hypothetical protein
MAAIELSDDSRDKLRAAVNHDHPIPAIAWAQTTGKPSLNGSPA